MEVRLIAVVVFRSVELIVARQFADAVLGVLQGKITLLHAPLLRDKEVFDVIFDHVEIVHHDAFWFIIGCNESINPTQDLRMFIRLHLLNLSGLFL